MHEPSQDLATIPPPKMTPKPAPAFSRPWMVASAAIVVGVVVDTAALHQPPGLGLMVGLWIGLIAAASAPALLSQETPSSVLPVLGAGLFVASFVGIRTSPVLLSLNVGAAVGVIAVLAQLPKWGGLGEWTITRYWRHPLTTFADMTDGSGRFVMVDLPAQFGDEHTQRLRSVAVGVLLGIPLLALFGALFVSADMVFSDYIDRLADSMLFGGLFWRAVFSLVVALAVVGLWRAVRRPRKRPAPSQLARRLDVTTSVTVLAMLVVLFLLFVVAQVIAPGPELVRFRDFSENARRGFFQLVVVAFLVLNVLLLFDWFTNSGDDSRSPAFDKLAILLITLTGVVMVSAMNRMRLYVNAFGLTELRFYTSVFMVWLAFVLVWFIRTVLRNRRATFAVGLMVSGLLFIIGLSVANPDALIVRLNWDRHLDGASFSDRYNSELSVDSIPALISIRDADPSTRWCFIERRLATSRAELGVYWDEHGVRGDSWAAWRARIALGNVDVPDSSRTAECVDPRQGRSSPGRGD